jgi:hypothetical protein
MGLSLADLQEEIYDNLGMSQDDISLTKVNQNINRAFWEISKKLKFREQDDSFVITLTPGTNSYAIGAYISDLDAIRHLTILDTQNASTIWTPIQQTTYEELMDVENDTNPAYQIPTKYARFESSIVFNYLPSYAYQVKVWYKKSLGDVLISGPPVPEEWHEVIAYGATARCWINMGSVPKASQMRAMMTDILSTMIDTETKEERDYSMSSARLIKARYP